jgi:hypothetical protein
MDVGATDGATEDGLGEGIILLGDGDGCGIAELEGGTIEEALGFGDADADSVGVAGSVVVQGVNRPQGKSPALISCTNKVIMIVNKQIDENFKRIFLICKLKRKVRGNKKRDRRKKMV